MEGFQELVHSRWNKFIVEGYPDYKLKVKLRMLKQKLKDWSKATFGEMSNKKTSLLEELGGMI